MIIQVDNGAREPIQGVARQAAICIDQDVATVAIEPGAVIALPQAEQVLNFAEGRWRLIGSPVRTRQATTFTCRRLADG